MVPAEAWRARLLLDMGELTYGAMRGQYRLWL